MHFFATTLVLLTAAPFLVCVGKSRAAPGAATLRAAHSPPSPGMNS